MKKVIQRHFVSVSFNERKIFPILPGAEVANTPFPVDIRGIATNNKTFVLPEMLAKES